MEKQIRTYSLEYLTRYRVDPSQIQHVQVGEEIRYNAKQVDKAILKMQLPAIIGGLIIFILLFLFAHFFADLSQSLLFALVITYLFISRDGSTKGK